MPRSKATIQTEAEDLFVIGIGASAGGLQAMDDLFSHVPSDSVSYIIVQHLSLEHRSLLTELLKRHSVLEVIEAQDNMEVQMNKVYVIPNNQELRIKYNRLHLNPKIENGRSRTIDTFFKSLAADKGYRSIGIILSGTGTDGTEGVVAIKKAGGMVIVQDPVTAKFDGMPRNAINTGFADFILPPQEMPREIFNYVKVTPLINKMTDLVDDDKESSFTMILEMVRDRMGIDFSNYKRPTIIRRISRRMALNNISNLTEYLDHLNLHPKEVEALSKEFLIGVTKFFRDKDAYEVLAKKVIPDLIDQKEPSSQLRVWIAGCSSGEEAYSIAILIREIMDEAKKELEVKIFASDIDREALNYAGKGIYPASSLSEVSQERIERFFVQEDGRYRITQRIRKMVIFAPHNVINDPPFSKIDLISCRNMLIYLNPVLQKKVITKFHYALQVGGYLFLGSSESIGDIQSFTEVSKKWKIWRSNEPAHALSMEVFSGNGLNKSNITNTLINYSRDLGLNTKRVMQHNFSELLNEAILEEQGYAAVFLDENYDIIHGVGKFKNYMDLPEQNFTINLLKLVPSDLAVNLGNLLRKAIRDREKVAAYGVQIRHDNSLRYINVVVKPYLSEKKLLQKFILVIFSEDQPRTIIENGQPIVLSDDYYENRVQELESELQHTKEDLQAVVEELETSNEELQSTNEELLSSNEELQSTNEELQSLNEELHTINTEHQYKIKALMELDDDLNNYFRSTDIGQIFVDHQLIIRKYTPAATKLINLIESDIGRTIYHISTNLRYQALIEDIRKVIVTNNVFEKEVQDKNGIWYQMRILPYITQERRIDGAIIIFVEINELKNLHLMQAGILDSSPNAIASLKSIRNNRNVITDFTWNKINHKGQELLLHSESELQGKALWKHTPSLLENGLFDKYVQVVETGDPLEIEQELTLTGKACWLLIVAVKLDDGLVLTLQDITQRKQNEQQLLRHQEEIKQNAERFRTMLEAMPHITWTNAPSGESNSFNQYWYSYTGLTAEQSFGWGWERVYHPDDLKVLEPNYKRAMLLGEIYESQARILRLSDKQYRWHLIKVVPIRNAAGQLILWIGTATDIQDQKDAEKATIRLRLSQQREILKAILQTQEAERKNISETLHNGLGQLLYAAKLNLSGVTSDNSNQKQKIEKVLEFLSEGIEVTRNISHEMAPTVLKDFGVKTAVEEMIKRLNTPELKMTSEISGFDERLDYLKEVSLYRIIQELLNNVLKHSGATQAHIKLNRKNSKITLVVKDNGFGFNKESIMQSNGIGLKSIQNRVDLLEGKMEINSTEGDGTQIKITLED